MNIRERNEIQAMYDRLEDDIFEHGWEASVDGASNALRWVLGYDQGSGTLERFMTRPDVERRAEWIARGGDPKYWPDQGGAVDRDLVCGGCGAQMSVRVPAGAEPQVTHVVEGATIGHHVSWAMSVNATAIPMESGATYSITGRIPDGSIQVTRIV